MQSRVRLVRGYQSDGMPGIANSPKSNEGFVGDTAADMPGLKVDNHFSSFTLFWKVLTRESYLLISQAGWSRCNLIPKFAT